MSRRAPPIPEKLRALMAEVGPKWGTNITEHVKLMAEGFSEVLADAPKEGEVTRDIPYGPHPRNVLDVYVPTTRPRSAPVIIFLHGGAFVDGQKDRTLEFYSNVCWYFVRHGIVAINMENRLAPEFKYPSGSEDVAGCVAWARRNIERFGGDPSRIFVMGHSAGAAHVGCYAYDKRFHPAEGSGVAGLIVLSGRVRCETLPDNPNAKKVEAYFGTDPKLMEQGSVVNHVTRDSVATMIAIGEFENPLLDIHCLELAWRIAEVKRRAPRFVWLPQHNHTSTVAHLNTADDVLGSAIREFIARGR